MTTFQDAMHDFADVKAGFRRPGSGSAGPGKGPGVSANGRARTEQTSSEQTQEPPPRRVFLTPFEEIDERDLEPMRYLVKPHLPAGEATMLYAPPRNFKSFMTMEWALSVALGRPLFERYEAERGIVVYIDLENRLDRLRERIRASLARDGLTNAALEGRLLLQDRGPDIPRWWLDLDCIGQLGEQIAGLQPALVIVDNLRKALPYGLSENKNEEVNPLLNAMLAACERAEAAFLLVHHTNKGYEQFSGASVLEATMANVIKMKREPGSAVATVSCVNMRNAEDWDAFGVQMGARNALELTDPVRPNGLAEQAVREALRHGGRTILELVGDTDLPDADVRAAVTYLLEAGVIIEVGVRFTGGQDGRRGRGRPPKVYGLAAD
jgi:hypothetical protein